MGPGRCLIRLLTPGPAVGVMAAVGLPVGSTSNMMFGFGGCSVGLPMPTYAGIRASDGDVSLTFGRSWAAHSALLDRNIRPVVI